MRSAHAATLAEAVQRAIQLRRVAKLDHSATNVLKISRRVLISMNRVGTFQNMKTSPLSTDSAQTSALSTPMGRRFGLIVVASLAVIAFAAAPAGAQTYSNGSDGSTGQGQDDGTTTTTTATTQPGSSGTGSSGGGSDDGVVGQADDGGGLAFTGADSLSLALIGAGVAIAGGLLVVGSRRRVDQPV